MQKVNIPEGYNQVMPYLIIKDAAGFLKFTQDVFGAEERMKHMRDEHIIMHAEIKIGDCSIMFADATDEFSSSTAGMFIYVVNADETYAKALAAGATSVMPMCDQPYGRTGGVKDPHGNTWWVTSV
ncbi:MAG: hypothetical protein JWQ38_2593 [Flavipsychrobacter sp.]|nr:hypothetical protein [Flavipsychrobacter sp.]